jgi:hypothetical protein
MTTTDEILCPKCGNITTIKVAAARGTIRSNLPPNRLPYRRPVFLCVVCNVHLTVAGKNRLLVQSATSPFAR